MAQTAWAVDKLSSDAQVIRQSIGSLIGAAGGTVGPNGLAVTQKGTPDLHVLISGGTPEEGGLWIPGFTATTGPYYFQNTASFELAIPAANATNPRIERIVARVYDNAVDSSGKEEAVFEAIKGTATAGATLLNLSGEAALPKNCYTLAHVLVPALATTIVTADILDAGTQFSTAVRSGEKPALTERAYSAEIEPSATRMAFVTVIVRRVDTKQIGSTSFLCPPATKFKLEGIEETKKMVKLFVGGTQFGVVLAVDGTSEIDAATPYLSSYLLL